MSSQVRVLVRVGFLAATTAVSSIALSSVDPFSPWLRPVTSRIDPEQAHRLAVTAARWGVFGRGWELSSADKEILSSVVWGIRFPNPVGLAAGFDKDGECFEAMIRAGFGFVEVGSVTPLPQPGNPRPRVFRLALDSAVINRYGFNSAGADVVEQRLADAETRTVSRSGVVAINVGKNKDSVDSVSDYVQGVKQLGPYAQFIVVNVSSPNTPGLRDLQAKQNLLDLIIPVREEVDKLPPNSHTLRRPPLLLKIAPDLSDHELRDIAEVAKIARIDGLVVSNTTVTRPPTLESPASVAEEVGGLSGKPLFNRSTDVLKKVYHLTGGSIPLIGVGGVSSGSDAYLKIRAGASLVEIYTHLVFRGPRSVNQINKELLDCLRRDGFTNISQAVGADHKSRHAIS
mmetsp:Transcript_17980/g.37288  ORF Transcript_17980/g.37288 Transcript_17980/m.37288 type:complete len:400 (-) Transcript_17980:1015-2214(-)